MKTVRKWLLGCLTILLAAACQPSITQTKMASSPKPRVASEPVQTIQTACKNLHKVVDIDDLLKQMYDNLDSQCLFDMPTAQLEKIWGIRIFGEGEYPDIDFEKKPVLFLQKISNNQIRNQYGQPEIKFEIHTTKAHQKKYSHYSSFSGSVDLGQFPKYLPQPDNRMMAEPIHKQYPPNHIPVKRKIPKNTVYRIADDLSSPIKFYWINHHQNKDMPVLIIGTFSTDSLPEYINFYNFYQPYWE